MRVSVVVPTFRRLDLLARCLDALRKQTLPHAEYEVIVADDGADDGTRRQVESYATGPVSVRYIPVTGAHGPAAARNVGWQAAIAEVIAFTDDDCIPDRDWLAAGIEPFADPAVVAVTGKTIVPLSPKPTDFERNLAGLERSEFITANCFCRRTALQELHGFDEQFTSAWREDSDLHFRLLDRGGQIVRVTDAVVVHPVRNAVWGTSLCEQRKALFEALLFRKHPHRFREQIYPVWPAEFYAILACATACLLATVVGLAVLAVVFAFAWLALTARFTWRRLKNTVWTARHVAEMLVTSALIPFLSVYWRLRGAARFRVLFW